MKSDKSLYDRDITALEEFLAYRKQKEAKERLQEALAYYEDAYENEYEDNGDNRKYRYG